MTKPRFFRNGLACVLLALCILVAPSVNAATCTAAGSGSWILPGTWSGCSGVTPGAADTVRINNGSVVLIPAGASVSVAAIEFGATGFTLGLTVDGTLSVGNVLHQGSAVIDGLGAITVTGTYNWTGNNSLLRGQLRPDGTASPLNFAPGSVWNLAGSPMRLIQRAVVQQGAANFSAGDIGCSSTVSWLIAPGAVLTISHAGTIGSGGANCLIRNEGTIRKSGAGSSFRLTDPRVRLENHGLIEVLAGSFDFEAGGGPTTHTGIFRTGAGATFGAPRSAAVFNAGTRFEGPGTVSFASSGARSFSTGVDFAGPVTLDGSGSDLIAAAGVTLNFTGGIDWRAGRLSGPGTFRVPSGRTLTLTSAGAKALATGAQLLLEGSTLWQAGELVLSPSSALPETRLFNAAGANFEVQFRPATITMGGGSSNMLFENAGTFTATAAANAGLLTMGASGRGAVLNRGNMTFAGAVRSETNSWRQTAGQLLLDDVQIALTAESFNQPLELGGGVLAGDAVFSGALRNTAGLILPGGAGAIGTIGVNGRYEEGPNAAMTLEIGGTALDAHDSFVVGGSPGSAALAGTLRAVRQGSYQFSPGDLIPLVIANSRGGQFSSIDIDPAFLPQPQVLLLENAVVLGIEARIFANGFEAP